MTRKLSKHYVVAKLEQNHQTSQKSVEIFNGKITSMIKIHFPLSALRITQSRWDIVL